MRIALSNLQYRITDMETPDSTYWRTKLLEHFGRRTSEVLGASFKHTLTVAIGDESWGFTGTTNCGFILLQRLVPHDGALHYTIMPLDWTTLDDHLSLMRLVIHPVADGRVEAVPGPDVLLFDDDGKLCSEHILEPHVIKLLMERMCGPM